jgi:plastocyanin
VSKSLVLATSLLGLGGLALVASSGQSSAQGKTSGTISGTIQFSGKAPARKTVDTSSDAACGAKQESDAVVVTKGKLRDVHVRIKNGTAGKHKASSAPVVIEQTGCVYLPHVVGAMVGQPVAIRNKDKTMHNVHAYIGKETWFNRSQPKGAPDIVERDTGEAGEVFELKCNVHAWMHSYMPITDHPYFDVSGSDGAFAIKNVPAGSYTLEAWHPTLGLKSTKVTVGKSGTTASFSYP